MSAGGPLTTRPIDEAEYEQVLPLISDYQRFYGVTAPDLHRNDAFFRRFLPPQPAGMLIGCWADQRLAGYGCLYWTFSSVAARDIVLLNDLYVQPQLRGQGIGRALLDHAKTIAAERGAHSLQWMTSADNYGAQQLYDRTTASRTAWIEYTISLTQEAQV